MKVWNKVCNCEGDCDCITVKPEGMMLNIQADGFVSKMNVLDDREFEKAMRKLQKEKAKNKEHYEAEKQKN